MNNNTIKYNTVSFDLPENWRMQRLKNLCTEKNTYGVNIPNSKYEESGVRFLRTTDIDENGNIGEGGIFIAKKNVPEGYFLNKGDVLFSRSGTIGRCYFHKNEEEYTYAGFLVKFKPKNIDISKWLYYFSFSKYFKYQLSTEAIESTIFNFNGNKYSVLKVAIPNEIETVRKINNFLDKKCEQINQFIADKKQLINLLKEQRQSVINSHVNKSEDEDSINWVTHKLKHISDIKFSNVDKLTHKGEVKVKLCNYVDVYKNDYITNNIEFMLATATLEEIEKFKVFKGDIIITKDSESANDIGIPAFVSENIDNLVCAYHLAMIRANQEIILDEFLFRKIESKEVNSQFEVNATGVTRVGLSIADISNVLISYPKDINIQKDIIAKIKSETKTIDETIFKTEEELRLVAEYKEALISNAVTGQLSIA
ncbi:restriction modification system DNA specificity domain protein [Pseudopedobacter saltans DSM 12145]|uniref:Restriction modification system DNA specificity domain protein n=1 Tax=Pseudopedobacter saltans (strain ATCC 51119 / DSM 12145 / JCM 21818 / CCUG 39354 / LMG 10337 / NBRC 100064 / NCIMB 13643) TaxID=762903 RepID=F0S990_PSESL|nr:restriction modification system DNA specificity domain-containing protein [Pseudopedobacter saltans]ADY52440.1 restriction modification system DNA specificity domain protein [Pseudopedobacter saltans DSM 12145]